MDGPNLSEQGASGQHTDRRLYMQLLAFGRCSATEAVIMAVGESGIEAVVYEDALDPFGVGVLAIAEDPELFVTELRTLLRTEAFAGLQPKPRYSMFGRTYALGHEPDLDDALLMRPRRHALDPETPWAIWYPLRRSGRFAQLPPEQQKDILKEHAHVGMAFGRAGYARDIRLACYGLDPADNDFVIGLMGRELTPLSKLVETMRKTQQTSLYLERLGPFFVGRVAWQSHMATEAIQQDDAVVTDHHS